MSKVAAILIRGMQGMRQEVRDTLKMLNLNTKHAVAVFDDNKQQMGMLKKVENYITFGEVSEETIKLIESQKGKDKTARLHPPRGGFERKGIKQPFTTILIKEKSDLQVKRKLKKQ
jgi:ribosomal protein L30/L7E